MAPLASASMPLVELESQSSRRDAGSAGGDPLLGVHHLQIRVETETSCSQSWEQTTWSGPLELRASASGEASLSMVLELDSILGGWGSGDPPSRMGGRDECVMRGQASRVDGALVLDFEIPDEPSICASWPDPDREGPAHLSMRCIPARVTLGSRDDGSGGPSAEVLRCELGELRPRILDALILSVETPTLMFGDPRLTLKVVESEVFDSSREFSLASD